MRFYFPLCLILIILQVGLSKWIWVSLFCCCDVRHFRNRSEVNIPLRYAMPVYIFENFLCGCHSFFAFWLLLLVLNKVIFSSETLFVRSLESCLLETSGWRRQLQLYQSLDLSPPLPPSSSNIIGTGRGTQGTSPRNWKITVEKWGYFRHLYF